MVKRVSTDEKLTKILDFFRAKPDIYCIKDLEKMLPKECPSVTQMLVPDLLKRLQDDNLINVEKMGNTNIYWSFKSQPYHYYTCEIEKLQLAIESYEEDNKKKQKHLKEMEAQKCSSPEKTELLGIYTEIKKKYENIERIKKQNSEYSAEEFEKLNEEVESLKSRINKTTDDIFSLQNYICNKFGMGKREFNESFNLKDNMDYV